MHATQYRLLAVLLLALATLSLFGLVERYVSGNSQLLRNGNFAAGLAAWRTNGTGDQLRVENGVLKIWAGRDGQAPSVRQILARPEGGEYLRLSAWVRHEGVRSGLRDWHAMRLLLVAMDGGGDKLWELPHVVEQGQGSGPWRRVSRVFYLPPRVAAVVVIASLNQVAGSMEVRDLTLEQMHEDPVFQFSRRGLASLWLLALPWLIWPLWRQRRLTVIAMGVIILAGTLISNAAKHELRRSVQDIFRSKPEAVHKPAIAKPKSAAVAGDAAIPDRKAWMAAQKIGHVVFFAILALAARWAWRNVSWRRLALYLVAFAATVETLQLLSLDRSAHPLDAGLNVLGIVAGLAAFHLFFRRHLERTTAPDPPNA
ncbi:MAG: VanZ family protein [Alphaproteobacteria bacterium]